MEVIEKKNKNKPYKPILDGIPDWPVYQLSKNRKEFLAEIATLLGGYIAEKVIFGQMTTGASNDLRKASEIARSIVKEYGMSSLGPVSFGEKEELVFLGKEISEERNYSERTSPGALPTLPAPSAKPL